MSEIQNGIQILLTAEDAQVYHAFKLNREKFITLLASGFFDCESGRADVNFNNNQIQSVYVYKQTYRRDAKSDRIPI